MKSQRSTRSIALGAMVVGSVVATSARADIGLFEWAINQNGIITGIGDPLPAGSVFDTATGLGTVRLVFTGVGAHSGVLFVDHEISEPVNTFFNELGAVSGTPGPGQSWEIDEPGFSSDPGDIFDNFLLDSLDGSIGKTQQDDVSMAMGFSFNLAAGETGTILFLLTETAPSSGFYLLHTDPDSGEVLYFSGALRIVGTPVVPEGQTILGGGALALMALASARKFRNRNL